MAISYNDKFLLSQDSGFRNRVEMSMIAACIAISNEGWSVPFHRERSIFCNTVLQAPSSFINLFAGTVATDTNCINDATATGTVVLTSGNVATQAALVTDAHIDAAISSQFNSFIKEPAN